MRNTNTARRRDPMAGRKNYMYMHTSAAPVFPQEEYDYEKPRKKKRIKPDSNYDYVRVAEKRSSAVWQLVFPLVIVCAFALCFLVVSAKISAVKTEIKETQALTQKTKTVNESLEILLSESTDLEEVKKIATTRLGMQTAADYQIRRINVQKDSYTINYEDKVAEEKNRTILDKIGITGKE
ncbi:MAG: hypothetical protein IJR45_02255 [Firmicutes bacterium]|nr:hypothetical protein [Bacillota bacterium]MBQ9604213.1 hypothetical protein [Bacillota bacterium]